MIVGQQDTYINETQCTNIKHIYYYPPICVPMGDISNQSWYASLLPHDSRIYFSIPLYAVILAVTQSNSFCLSLAYLIIVLKDRIF